MRRPLHLLFYVLLRVLPAALLVLLAIWYSVSVVTSTAVRQEVDERLAAQAVYKAEGLSRQLQTLREAVQALAGNALVLNSLLDVSTRAHYLPAFFRSLRLPGPAAARLTLIDYRGRVIISTHQSGSYTETPWLSEVMQGAWQFDLSHERLRIVAPVQYAGRTEGAVVVEYEAKDVAEILTMTSDLGAVVVFDAAGRVLSSSDTVFGSVGGPVPLIQEASWLQKRAAVPGFPALTVVTAAATEQVFASVYALQRSLLLAMLANLLALIAGIGVTAHLVATERQQVDLALQQAKEAAESANRAKSEFLTNMSHELRTPLHGILSFAGFGLKRATTAPPAKLHDYFQHIDQNGRILLLLLNDLLDLAKWEAGRMPYESQHVDLGGLLAVVVDELSSLTAEKRLTIHFSPPDSPVDILVDPTKIMQVLRNLLSNAVKFSPDGESIEITLHSDASSVIVGVHDHGVGIPEAELVTIFDQFVQSSRTKTGAGGTGLGLAICREIVTAHHGRIWAEHRPGGGASLCFALPLQVQDESITKPGSMPPEAPLPAADQRTTAATM